MCTKEVKISYCLHESLTPPSHTLKFNLYLHVYAPLKSHHLSGFYPSGEGGGPECPSFYAPWPEQSIDSLPQCNSGEQAFHLVATRTEVD